MCGYPFFIPEFVLFTNSSLFWFKIANERSEFRNYLILFYTVTFLEHATARAPWPIWQATLKERGSIWISSSGNIS